jgi:hypothetical protein
VGAVEYVVADDLPTLVWLANLGLPGTLCYLAFLKLALTGPSDIDPTNSHVIEASRQALLAALSAGLVACTVFDLASSSIRTPPLPAAAAL